MGYTVANIRKDSNGNIHADLRNPHGELVVSATLPYIVIRLEEVLLPAPKRVGYSECIDWVKKYRNDNGCTLAEAKFAWDTRNVAGKAA